jgi:hypothetical protein
MTGRPTNSTEAAARLETLKADAGWRERFLANEGAAKKEFHELSNMIVNGPASDSAVELAMSGKLPPNPSVDQQMMTGTAQKMREMGFPQLAIHETIVGKAPTEADVERARVWKAQVMRNPDFTKRYLAGDGDAAREMMAANIVLASQPDSVATQ